MPSEPCDEPVDAQCVQELALEILDGGLEAHAVI